MTPFWIGVATPFAVAAACFLLAYIGAAVSGWYRSRRALISDWTDERARAAASVMLTRRLWAIRIPGTWIWIGRPIYRDAPDSSGRVIAHYENALRDAHQEWRDVTSKETP